MARSRLHRRFKKRRSNPKDSPGPKRNPPLLTDLAEFIGPGFAGFAATRFATYVATGQVEQRKPEWGKHAGAVTSIGAFLAAWLLAHRWKWLAKYQTPLMVGAGIAAIQTLLQLYLPKLGWMVGDPTQAIDAAQPQQLSAPTSSGGMVNYNDLQAVDEDPGDYTYNDSYDAGRQSRQQQQQPGGGEQGGDMLDDLDDVGVGVGSGIFQN